MQPDLEIASFDYQGAMLALTSEPATWPASTRTISELRLAIKYQPKKGLLAKFSDTATLYLDIVDYPGEWLLDLPLLGQIFAVAEAYPELKANDNFQHLLGRIQRPLNLMTGLLFGAVSLSILVELAGEASAYI